MIKFIKRNSLPEGKVSSVIISHKNKEIINRVEAEKINTILCFDNPILSNCECFHSDMQILHLENDRFLVLNNINDQLVYQLFNLKAKIIKSTKTISRNYPNNILLNTLIINRCIFGKINYLDDKILDFAESNNFKLININQGYAKCSAAIVSNDAIITADKKLYTAAKKNNLDCLLIRPGYINLDNADYGFIGGCCGKISKDILAFTGDITKHPDYKTIKAFALNHNVLLHSLSNNQLDDIGGIIPITEFK